MKALAYQPPSAIYRTMHGHHWGQLEATLADSYDRLGQLAGVMVAVQGGKPRKLDPYPRPEPLRHGTGTDTRTRGEALPIADVLAWAAESEGPPHGE